jgi:hypothetical protein
VVIIRDPIDKIEEGGAPTGIAPTGKVVETEDALPEEIPAETGEPETRVDSFSAIAKVRTNSPGDVAIAV